MTCIRRTLFGSLFAIAQASIACSESTTIKVIDEYNKGVDSRVYYNDGTHRHSFFKTDNKGEVPQPAYSCSKISTFFARPIDSDKYFDSAKELCASKVILRTLTRQTTMGNAISFEIIPFTLPDGSSAVLILKAGLNSTSKDLNRNRERPQCEVQFNAIADQQAFRVEGDNWIGLKRVITEFSNVFADARQPDLQTVTFQYPCNAAGERVRMLQKIAADRIARSAMKNAVRFNEILRSLGYQPDDRTK